MDSSDLRRSVGLTGLVLYGMGTIIGAGIYVLAGAVAREAGMAAPLAFLMAGGLAALTALSYAELAARHPEATGVPAYLHHAFGSALLGRLAGLAIALVAVTSAASIAKGGAGYLVELVPGLPVSLAAGGVIVLFTAIAAWGVAESVTTAALMTLVEIGGLILVIGAGAASLESLPTRLPEMWPGEQAAWAGVAGATFLAFFAFTGFDNMVVMAEETRDVTRILPRAILMAIGLTTVLYMAVLVAAVLAVPPERLARSQAPLSEVTAGLAWLDPRLFLVVAVGATLNGVLIEIVTVSRVVFGMARRAWLPRALARVHPRRKTPLRATLAVGGVILALTVALPFETLVRTTSGVILSGFAVVNLALWRLHRRAPRADLAIRSPRWGPPLGAASCLVLLAVEILR